FLSRPLSLSLSLGHMSQALLGIRPFPKPSSLFSYTLSDSQRKTTETSTIWGPGTLSGRAILALGEVTLRGINNLGIRCRLATIRLRAPSLNKAMCDDLLEFSRPKYSMLVLALCEWPQDEARGSLHPSKRQLKEIYNFLVAIIQVKEQWRHIVGEACAIRFAYSANMRAEMWLSLQNCGLPWQKQILRIEGIMAQFKASELDLPAPMLLDAITDLVIFTRLLQSAAVFCLRQINGTRWRPVCELFGFPPIGFTSSTLVKALDPHQECSAQELADAQNVLRKVSSNAWDELCIHTIYPSQITDAAILLTLRNICHDSGSSGTQVALCLCALSNGERTRVIETLIRDVPLILCSMDSAGKMLAIQSLCDFMATVLQITGSHAYIPMAVSTIPGLTPEMEHPVVHFWREMNERKPACGMDFGSSKQSTPQFFDALADAVIFTRFLVIELRNLAINCLLDHCVKSRQWDILHQVFSFDPQIERLMFTTLRDKLSQKELYDFVRASPPSSTQFSDLFFLLSGWAIGLQYNMESGMF
ncbi:hypothetical protein B0H14DRAFT_2784260, partial [Mycena olivaceomarginata]